MPLEFPVCQTGDTQAAVKTECTAGGGGCLLITSVSGMTEKVLKVCREKRGWFEELKEKELLGLEKGMLGWAEKKSEK